MTQAGARPREWVVLGAGMLGLTLALRLAAGGARVRVLEAAPEVGGLTASHRLDGLTWDRYYHVVAARDRALLALLDELGLAAAVAWRTTRTLFYDGRGLHPLDNAVDYLRLPALPLLAKLRIGLNILYGTRFADPIALDALPAEAWLRRWSGDTGFEHLWRPLLQAKLGDNHRFASAAYLRAVMARFHGAREGARQTETFGFVSGGYARIVDALLLRLATLGVTVETGSVVRQVTGSANGVVIDTAAGERCCDEAVITFASPLALALCGGLGADERARHGALRYQGVVCLSLLLRRPLGGAYMTYITDPAAPFTTVIEMSALTGTSAWNGHHLVYLPRYVAADDPWMTMDDDSVAARFLAGLARLYPGIGSADVVAKRCARAAHVMALPTPGYAAALPPFRTAVPGLSIVNSAHIVHASLSVDETVQLAERAATALTGRT